MLTRIDTGLNARDSFRKPAHRQADEYCDADGPALLLALEEPAFITNTPTFIKRDLHKIAVGIRQRTVAGCVDPHDPFCSSNSLVLRPLNNCALLQLYYGEVAKARALTQYSLDIVSGFLRAGAPDGWGIWVIAAQVNMARLAALEGDCDEAVSIYRSLLDLVTGRSDYRVGEVLVQKELCSRTVSLVGEHTANRGDVVGDTIASCLQGSCKAFLITRRYEQLLKFMAEVERDERLRAFAPELLFLECRARSLAGLGRSMDAVELIHDALKGDSAAQNDRPGLVLLQAQMEASLGLEPNKALDALEQRLVQSAENRPAAWYLLYRCALVHMIEAAWNRCEALLAPMHLIANSLRDQVAMMKTGAMELVLHSTRASWTTNIEATLQSRFDWLGTVYYRLESAVGFLQLASIARKMDGMPLFAEKCTVAGIARARSTSLHLARQLAQAAAFPAREDAGARDSFTHPEIELLYDEVLHRPYAETAMGL
ncbi:MAG TPA: hypothetical protein VFP71_08305 [Candidatus Angelobacter sp.]|nr:hypothetical protein [Candidatus Angelobacter sp.]